MPLPLNRDRLHGAACAAARHVVGGSGIAAAREGHGEAGGSQNQSHGAYRSGCRRGLFAGYGCGVLRVRAKAMPPRIRPSTPVISAMIDRGEVPLSDVEE